MNQYELQNAIHKIHGYYLPPDTFGVSLEYEFEKAQTECIDKLTRELSHVKAISCDQFLREIRNR